MSEERFDELSKALATSISRRQALKLVAATAFGGALSLVGAGRASATAPGRCRKIGTICRQHYECCDYYCDEFTGRCACPPGANLCPKGPGRPNARCVFCPDNATFDPETCQCRCVEGTTECRGFYLTSCCPPGTECCPSGFCSYNGVCY